MSGLTKAAVLGAGTMGHGIAQVLAMAGVEVTLCDLEQAQLDHAQDAIERNLAGAVARGKLDEDGKGAALSRVILSTDRPHALAQVELVIEAIPELMELKKQVLAEASREAPVAKLVATNTSSLSVTEIAQATDRPERVVGLHFFNPVHVQKLVEVVRGERTTEAALTLSLELVAQIGKQAVVVHDSPGFASSRLGLVLGLEAIRMVEQGVASAADVDKAMELGYRHPMGPLMTTDYVGLDVRLAIAEHLHREVGEAFRPPQLLRRLVRAGKHGRKAGEGFYRWDDDGKCLGPA